MVSEIGGQLLSLRWP